MLTQHLTQAYYIITELLVSAYLYNKESKL